MNKILTAIALAIALPAAALAQTAPAPAPKAGCCEQMKDKGSCKGMDHSKMDHSQHDMKGGATSHAGHDMPQSAGKSAPADPHANHQR